MYDRDVTRVELKIDKLDERQDRMEIALTRLATLVEQHGARQVERLDLIESDLLPVKKHVNFMKNCARFVGVIASGVLFFKSLELF
jgi:hypothetical protein